MKKRIVYIDKLKALAIFFICFIHYTMLSPSCLDNFVDMFCFAGVSIFFMVNGALLLNKNYSKSKHIKKTVNMLIVLFFWEIISLIYFAALYDRNFQNFSIKDIISYFFGCIRWELPTGHFWFVIALVSIYLLFLIIKPFYDMPGGKKTLLQIILLIVLLDFIPNDIDHIQNYMMQKNSEHIAIEFSMLDAYLPFGKYGYAFVYFAWGGLVHNCFYVENRLKDSRYRKLVRRFAVFLIFVGWIYIYVMKGLATGFYGENFTNLPNGYACCGTLLLATGVYLSFLLNENGKEIKAINIISDNTLGIYYIHCLFLAFISYRLYPLIEERGIIINFIKALIVLFLSLGTTILIKKIPLLKKLV